MEGKGNIFSILGVYNITLTLAQAILQIDDWLNSHGTCYFNGKLIKAQITRTISLVIVYLIIQSRFGWIKCSKY